MPNTNDTYYLTELGRAIFRFAVLEYRVMYILEKLSPGYIHTYRGSRDSASDIARDLKREIRNVADTTLATQMALLHSEFCKLIKQRNDLLHANPATAPNGDQILIRQHFQAYIRWDFPTVRGATVAFDKANEIGGKIFEMLP
jgi:hypothetical protein